MTGAWRRAVVFDAGALIALERGDPRMTALVLLITREEIPAFVAAGALAQAWRGSSRQHGLARLLATRAVQVDPLDEATAKAVGVLLGSSRTSDVVDGHVALLGRRVRGMVYTSDPDDLARIDPALNLVPV